MGTKARELGQLAKVITVHDTRVALDRPRQGPGLLDSAQGQVLSTDSAEGTTRAANSALLNALIFGG